MADISLIQDDPLDDADEGVFEQGDGAQTDFKTLCPLLRIEKYGFSENAYDRQMVPRILLELFRSSPIDLLSTQLPSIMRCVTEMFKYSDAMIKAEFLEQIPIIAATAVECSNRLPELETLLSEYLLPMVVRNIGVNVNQIRKAAHTTLFLLIEKGFITQQQAEIQICPTVLALTNTDTPRDYDNCVVTLMSRLAHFLGRDVTERVFLQRFLQLCSSNMFYIRKMCAASFGDFCAVVGTEAYEYNLLPCYIALCEDDIWGVRKSCAEVVLSVSCACPSSKRRTTLAPIFSKLLKDESRWVRMSAFQALGPFISTFADPTVASLGYSNLGELVLVNSNGNEFKITPTDEDTNMDLHMLMIEEAKKNLINEFEDQDANIGNDKEDYFKITSSDEENVCANLNSDNCLVSDINNVEDISQENSITEIVCDSKENGTCDPSYELDVNSTVDAKSDIPLDIMKEVINLSNCCDNLNKLHCLDVDESDTSEDLLKHENNYLSNHNLNKTVDSIADNCINDVDNESKCTNSYNDKNNEDLEQFNSYNYWYVSLNNIPLDPNLINDDLANQKCMFEENSFTLNSGNHSRNQDQHKKMYNHTSEYNDSIIGISTVISQSTHHYQVNEPMTAITGGSNLPNITEISQHIVPQLLIDHFVSMTDPILASNTDNEMAYHCAYSLPAVALTLGSNNWHLLKKTVEILAANMQYKVRRTVASSLHELAIILGQDITTANLTHIFEGFLKDLDEVRIGILKHLAHFLQLINPSQRSTYLPRLAEFLQTDNDANWRFRQELAEQLLLAVPLFHPTDANKYISTLAQDLLCDKVAAVRDVSILLVTELIRHVSSDRLLLSRLLFKLAEQFAHSKRWKQRQSFALLCTQLLSMQALFPESFACDVMPHLLDLSWDPVANVRLVVARTISQHIITNEYFLDVNNQHLDGLESVLRRLKSDKDRDVRYSANLQVCTNV